MCRSLVDPTPLSCIFRAKLLLLQCNLTQFVCSFFQSIEMGADTLLVDEDTCATNFMIRDDKMMQLVAKDKEPITPFVNIVRSLYDDHRISSIMVIGGVGDYFAVADNVIVMDCYKCIDKTERAKEIVANSTSSQSNSEIKTFRAIRPRFVVPDRFSTNGKVKVLSKSTISYGETELDIAFVEQVIAKAQTTAISNSLQSLHRVTNPNQSLKEALHALDWHMDRDGLDVLAPGKLDGAMFRPRRFEIGSAMNRLRLLKSLHQ